MTDNSNSNTTISSRKIPKEKNDKQHTEAEGAHATATAAAANIPIDRERGRRDFADEGDVASTDIQSKCVPQERNISIESCEAIADSKTKVIVPGPIFSTEEPSFKSSNQQTSDKKNDQMLKINFKKTRYMPQ